MWNNINLIFILMCFKLSVSNKTEILSMKNDLTKSVKKVLISDVPSINQPNISGNKTIDNHNNITLSIINNKTNLNNSSKVPIEGGGYIHVVTNHSESTSKTPEIVTSKTTKHILSEGGGTFYMDNKTDTTLNVSQVTSSTVSPENVTERKISARKGVKWDEPTKLNNTIVKLNETIKLNTTKVTTTTPKITISTTRHHKPKYAMIIGDHETKERLSFIESPTTGKDYIFPIVLAIMSLPLIFYTIKLIYKRGSEYTERRHYDRMYLIDGMYNAR